MVVCAGSCVEVGGQLVEVSSLPLPCESRQQNRIITCLSNAVNCLSCYNTQPLLAYTVARS